MFSELHGALQRLLWEQGYISPRRVDISFEAPARERTDRLRWPATDQIEDS